MYEVIDRYFYIISGGNSESWFYRDSFIGEIFGDME